MFGKKKSHTEDEETKAKPENQQSEDKENNNDNDENVGRNENAGNDDPLELEKQKNAELHDKYLRLYSEFENFRRRTNKEKHELTQHANKDLILHILPVYDDLERALRMAEKAADKEAVVHGIELIFNKFKHVLKQAGIEEIETEGQQFDSELHDAITTIPAPTSELKGKIVDQIQKGYLLKDKVIRHAKVVVGE
jgi:molecular chaperone GrpE